MNTSMHWLSDRLRKCPDAADLEYGCVDWFRYAEPDAFGRPSRTPLTKRERALLAAGRCCRKLRKL